MNGFKIISIFSVFLIFQLLACKPETYNNNYRSIFKKSSKNKVIAIQAFEEFPQSLVILIDSNIRNFYQCQTIILKKIPLPANTFYTPRNRYRADSLIRFLRQQIQNDADHIIGLTTMDISHTNSKSIDYGIFGLGFCPGKSCVVSTFRYQKNVDENIFHERFIKICLHELGHNMGLPHCNTSKCFMQDAKGKISTVDQTKIQLCTSCKNKLRL